MNTRSGGFKIEIDGMSNYNENGESKRHNSIEMFNYGEVGVLT